MNQEIKSPKIVMISAKKLLTLQRNPQYLTPEQMDALKNSIKREGFVVNLIVRKKRGVFEIISGNHRFMAGQELKMKEYPCIVVNVSEQRAKVLAMNMNTIHGDPPAELIAPFLADLDLKSLGQVHLDSEMFNAVIEFDSELGEKLKSLSVVNALDNNSVNSPLPNCVCPRCGKRHSKERKN